MDIIEKRSSHGYEPEKIIQLIQADRSYDAPRPILDRVLITRHETETVFEGTHFIIPDTVQQRPDKGVVVAVGPETKDVCKPGDVVTFSMYNAEDVKHGTDTYTLVRIHDIKLVEAVTYVTPTH